MNKQNLVNFISKYHLNGNVIKVVITSLDSNELVCKFVSDTKSVIGEVKSKDISFGKECELGIYDTTTFLKLLSAISDEFEVKVFEVDKEAKYIELKDSSKNAKYILSHTSIIPASPKEIKFPPFEIEIEIDSEFIENFIKSKSALVDANTFVFKEESGTLKVILNYDANNQSMNTITFDIGKSIVELKNPLKFDANIFKEVLTVNKYDYDKGIIKLSSKGLMEIKFTSDKYDATYYQVMLNS